MIQTSATQIFLNEIYKHIANKELSFWCRIKYRWKEWVFLENNWNFFTMHIEHNIMSWFEETIDLVESIWHPVMPWDVVKWWMEVIGKKYSSLYYWEYEATDFEIFCWNLFYIWEDARKPIDEQPFKCKEFVYNLIKDNVWK